MWTFLRVAKARFLGLLRPDESRVDFDRELQIHLEMAIDDKIRQGLPPKEARRRARVELGNLTGLREAASEARGLPWVGSSWLDLKLGLRMLRRSWGLTLVAGFAMTVVIGLAAVAFEVLGILDGTDLPLDEGDRVVALQSWDKKTGDGLGSSPEDFERWRDTLGAVRQVSAFRTVERNLQTTESGDAGEPGETVAVAEISASAFRVARVEPSLGRPLLAQDQLASADPVLLIGELAWRAALDGDPEILGRRVRLDGTVHTIVGVMPEGFGFPIAHRYWIPLRTGPGSYAPDTGADDLLVFARLEDGATIEQAHSELNRVGRLPSKTPAASAAAEPGLRVVPYARAFVGDADSWVANLAVLVFMLLLVPPCINVAVLVYARTISRQGEFAARHVLGASRFRIVFQLFLEILVLAAGAGIAALAIARFTVWHLVADRRARGELPFWMDFELSPRTVLVVAVLAVFAALVAGAIPALRATGRRMQSGLKSLGGQPQQARLGAVWTALIVLQVAVSTALLPVSAEMVWGTVRSGILGPGFAADEYLTARLKPGTPSESDPEQGRARFERRQLELARALRSQPGIVDATIATHVPGEEPWLRIVEEETVEEETGTEVAEPATPPPGSGSPREGSGIEIGSSRVAQVNHVDERFFNVFRVPLLAGRTFESSDFDPSRSSVVVNRAFAINVLGRRNPIGRRFRYRAREGEEPAVGGEPHDGFEVVGVVADIHRSSDNQAVYHPWRSEDRDEVSLALRIRSDPTNAAGVLRSTAWSVDPALRLGGIRGLDEIYRQQAVGNYLGAGTLVAVTVSLLLLSAAGIYALMSFTVGRRRKEIGIRVALGAPPVRIVTDIFGRALFQVGLGAAAGIGFALLVDHLLPIRKIGGWELAGAVPGATAFIVAVAILALVGPARRGLRVEPVEELREG